MVRIRPFFLGILSFWGFFCFSPSDASAQQSYSIVFIQRNIPTYLHKDVPLQNVVDVSQFRRDIIRQAQHHPYLEVIPDETVETSLQASYGIQEVNTRAEIDITYADNLMDIPDYVSATTLLLRTTQDITQSQLAQIRPQLAARAWQRLAYAYISQIAESEVEPEGLRRLARLAFVELIRLAPHLTMVEGRQSPDRVAIYDEALSDFLSTPSLRQVPLRDAAALAPRLHADQIGRAHV